MNTPDDDDCWRHASPEARRFARRFARLPKEQQAKFELLFRAIEANDERLTPLYRRFLRGEITLNEVFAELAEWGYASH